MNRFFFVKQKTAYEMRISDWSSDVCDSDLHAAIGQEGESPGMFQPLRHGDDPHRAGLRGGGFGHGGKGGNGQQGGSRDESERSEEHTSELQSLMRISYAVFCLKKKKTKTN